MDGRAPSWKEAFSETRCSRGVSIFGIAPVVEVGCVCRRCRRRRRRRRTTSRKACQIRRQQSKAKQGWRNTDQLFFVIRVFGWKKANCFFYYVYNQHNTNEMMSIPGHFSLSNILNISKFSWPGAPLLANKIATQRTKARILLLFLLLLLQCSWHISLCFSCLCAELHFLKKKKTPFVRSVLASSLRTNWNTFESRCTLLDKNV